LPAFLCLSLRERIEVREIFWFLSPATDRVDAFHQAPDLGIDLTWKIAAFSMNYFQRYKEFPIELIRCRPDTFVNQIVELLCLGAEPITSVICP
jgi:hypothetical protein